MIALNNLEESWKKIFKIYAEDDSFTEPIDLAALSNPETEIHKLIVFIYSLDIHIHELMFNAASNQDKK